MLPLRTFERSPAQAQNSLIHTAPMTKPQLSLKRGLLRLFCWLAGIVIAFLTYSYFLGWQTDYYFMAHYTAHRMPQVNIVPEPLVDLASTKAPGTTLSYFGNSFEVPWKDTKIEKSPSNIAVVKFASGQVVMIWAPTGKTGLLDEIANDKEMGSPAMRAMFAEDIKAGPYEQESALLSVSSTQVHFFDPPRVSARHAFLLFFKAIAAPSEMITGIYSYQTSAVRGFQFGNPAASPHSSLEVYDLAGNSLGEVICFFGKSTSARGTQADINRIIQTFHVVTPSNSDSVQPAVARSVTH